MFPFSPIQIIERTPARLVVVDPPYSLAGMVIVVVALAIAGLYWLKSESDPEGRVGWPALLVAIPFFFMGLLLLTNKTVAILSRATNTLTVQHYYLGRPWRERVIPLSELGGADVASDQQTRGLALVLKSGESIWMGSFTDRKGYYAAADAINAFLGNVN